MGALTEDGVKIVDLRYLELYLLLRKLTLLLPLKTRMDKQIALIGKVLAKLNLYLRTLLRNNWELEELVHLEEM